RRVPDRRIAVCSGADASLRMRSRPGHLIELQARDDGGGLRCLDLGRQALWLRPESRETGRRSMTTFTIGDGGAFPTITQALALGRAVPGDTLALLSGYTTENATVGIENQTFSGDASNTGIKLWLSTGIIAITLTGSAPIAVTGNYSDNSITGNDGNNVLA